MPYQLDTHVLTVDANVISKVDTANPANLYSMWTVFSRCADSVEQGRRLENLSWRLWQKEQLVETEDKPITATLTLPQTIPSDAKLNEVPQLSGSVESILEADETIEFTSVSAPLEIVRPTIQRQDSSTSSRSHLEKMISSIVNDKTPLSAPAKPSQPTTMVRRKDTREPQPALERSGSTTTESQSPSKSSDRSVDSQPSPQLHPRTTVVRGFSPSSIPITQVQSATSTSDNTTPEPISSLGPKAIQSRNPTTFTLGGSYSSSEAGQTPETQRLSALTPARKRMFKLGGSSEEEGSLKSALSPRITGVLASHKKQASFSNVVTTHHLDTDNAIESESEDDYVDESAIDDDDDSSDWEDSIEDSGKSSVDDKYFKRVDSKVNLTSRRSLITLMLAQNDDRTRKLGNHASQSTSALPRAAHGPTLAASPNDSDEAPLMMKPARQPTLKSIAEAPRATAQAIPAQTTRGYAQAALSPRTTRRNMLATELTESLRRHLLWERQQKSATANAVMKRRHTSQDVANLKQYPDKSCMKTTEDDNACTWNQYFAKETFDSYHSKGW